MYSIDFKDPTSLLAALHTLGNADQSLVHLVPDYLLVQNVFCNELAIEDDEHVVAGRQAVNPIT